MRSEKAEQVDLADYLTSEQAEINRINILIETVRTNAELMAEYELVCEERIAIMMHDGGLSEAEAEAYVQTPGFIRDTTLKF